LNDESNLHQNNRRSLSKPDTKTRDPSDKTHLLLNENYMDLIDLIKKKAENKPELGLILKDKGYKKYAMQRQSRTS
jgi:hypothetical protein